jgi:hypothetical protein
MPLLRSPTTAGLRSLLGRGWRAETVIATCLRMILRPRRHAGPVPGKGTPVGRLPSRQRSIAPDEPLERVAGAFDQLSP